MIAGRSRAPESGDAGFTLIELLVVIIILGVLAAIAIPLFMHQRAKGWDVAVASDLRNAAIAQDAYLTDGGAGHFAASVGELQSLGFRPSAPSNYFDGLFAIQIGSSGDHYCMTARSQSGAFLGYSSLHGPVEGQAPLDSSTCT